ncbi:MAG TPA: helix-turn-helix domain-containing protein [Nitrososphaeraceae archaeon]|nr:helix-turn-helix domain-containing protein [Nitrososphaeraceae archaeon]
MRTAKLHVAYNREKDADVKERILLIRRIVEDKKHIEDVAIELHRSRAWAYKWYKRYNEDGLDGLKDKERSGRPPDVPKEIMLKIRKELTDRNTGWDFRQVMDLIYKKTGVRYHEVHIYRLLHKWGFKPKVPQKRFVNTASDKEKKRFKKE